MPIYQLDNKEVWFPPPELADDDGLLAVGGDLSQERLLLAYENGIFPWYNEGEPILWWSPNPRLVLYPDDLVISKSMRKVLRDEVFTFSVDTCFKEVMEACGAIPRHEQDGTWITDAMLTAYCALNEKGIAHSFEVWQNEVLVGGFYGLLIGDCFFGESMFSKVSNASKAGFITYVQQLQKLGVKLIDCQTPTEHLKSLGAVEIPRTQFLEELKELV